MRSATAPEQVSDSSAESKNILGFTRQQLAGYFASIGERPFHAIQVMQWLYHRGVSDFALMTDLSKSLRCRLAGEFGCSVPRIETELQSQDGTIKWALATSNSDLVEMVLIPDGRRNTLCVSSQVGCVLDCSFCATGKQGFSGNLSCAEIVGQAMVAQERLRVLRPDAEMTNIVFMGMGEPLFNFENVLDATGIFVDDYAFGLSKRRVTISTAGVVPRILDMCGRTDVSLAVSLHSPTDELRAQLIPLNRKFPLADLMSACQRYLRTLGDRRYITFEYTLLNGVNDSTVEAEHLVDLLGGWKCKVNLIPFNTFPGTQYEVSTPERIQKFKDVLLRSGITTTSRATRGADISAACGQLVGSVTDRTRRQARYATRANAARTIDGETVVSIETN